MDLPLLLTPRAEDIPNILANFHDPVSQPLSDFSDNLEKNLKLLKTFKDELSDGFIPGRKQATAVLESITSGRQSENVSLVVTNESFIPRTSCFTRKEQCLLFQFFKSMQSKEEPSQEQLKLYEERKSELQQEQESYLEYAKQQWLSFGHKRHSIIKPEVINYVNEWWKAKLERISRWPKYYEETCSVPLTLDSEISMKFVGCLETIGSTGLPPYRYINPWNERLDIHDALPLLKRLKNIKRPNGYFKCLKKYALRKNYHPDISNDSNARNLALEHNVHLVMAESVFRTLINNHNNEIHSWKLPVVIKQHKKGESEKKIVYIVNKLPPQEMNSRDRLTYFAKVSLESIFLTNKPSKVEETAPDRFNQNIEELLKLEGLASSNPDETEVREKKQKNSRMACQTKYNLFECAPADVGNVLMKRAITKTYNILIRIADKGTIDSGSNKAPCVIKPKFENQPELGFEIMTQEECANEWSSLFLRPNGKVKRVRVNPTTGDLLKVENVSQAEVNRDWIRTHGVNPENKLGVIYNVAHALYHLPVGNYLMVRDATQSIVATVYKENENSRQFSLTKAYQMANPERTSPEKAVWIPLDKCNLSIVDYHFIRPPCTFQTARKQSTTDPVPNPIRGRRQKRAATSSKPIKGSKKKKKKRRKND